MSTLDTVEVRVGRLEGEVRRMSERDLQRQICDYLRIQHYLTLEVGAYRRKTRCPACGHAHYAAGGHTAPGVPDLLVWKEGLRGLIGLELKTAHGRLSPAQAELAAAGATHIVRSLEDVQRVLLEHGMVVPIGQVW